MAVRLALFVAGVFVFLPGSRADENENVPDPLEGEWLAIKISGPKGEDLPKEAVIREHVMWTFKGRGMALFSVNVEPNKTVLEHTYSTDPAQSPKTIDLTLPDDRKQFGIYKIEKGKLTLCLTAPGASKDKRPKEFLVKDDGILLEMERPAKK